MKKRSTLSPEEAVRLVAIELDELMAQVMPSGRDKEEIPPGIARCIRIAVLAGIASGVKLAAINDASAEDVAIPLYKAVCAIANTISNPEVLN